MKKQVLLPSILPLAAASLMTQAATGQDVGALVNGEVAGLVETYQGIHAHPELSHHEERTAALLAGELRKAGFTVTEHIGKYPDGTQAYGLVGILQNGPGPRLLIRADMDALPNVTSKNAAGQDIGVMHACGHDVHVTTMIGTARALSATRAQWHGTVMLLGQPSEETIDAGKSLPGPHTSLFEPLPEPTLRTGVMAMTSVAIALLQP